MALRPPIQRQLTLLQSETDRLLNALSQVPHEELLHTPQEDAWSALQALNHIYLGERLSLQYVQYKLSRESRFPRLRPDAWLRTRILVLILRSRMKFKSPRPINMHDGQPVLSLPELQVAWGKLRKDLAELLEQHEPVLRYRMAYKQPYAGRMTLRQMLRFFREHLRHHDRQIREILQKSGDREV